VAVERTVFYRERAAGMHSAFPYAFGQLRCCPPEDQFVTLIMLLVLALFLGGRDIHILIGFSVLGCNRAPIYALVQASIYGVIVYAMIGFEWTAAKFFWYLFFMYFTLLYFTFYGMVGVGLTPNYQIASIVSTYSTTSGTSSQGSLSLAL